MIKQRRSAEIMNSHTYNISNNSIASIDQERFEFGIDSSSLEDARLEMIRRLAAAAEDGSSITIGDSDHRTQLLERIGGGSFGEVYLGELLESGEKVAVKIEPANCVVQSLLHEGKIYRKLQNYSAGDDASSSGSASGIPRLHWYGLHGREFTALVTDLMESTLYAKWVDCGERFSTKTVLMLIDQMIKTIERVHTKNVVHRDISPNNFMIGPAAKASGVVDGRRLYLIDFGHAKEVAAVPQFIPARRHRYSFVQPMVGTPRFASAFTHMGLEPSYRDDMESLGYIWIYLMKGRLPWQGLRPSSEKENKLEMISRMKCSLPADVLCDGLPQEFAVYLNYVRNLRHLEMPEHSQVREFFRGLARRLDIEYDWAFDWTTSRKIRSEGEGEMGSCPDRLAVQVPRDDDLRTGNSDTTVSK